MGWRCRSTLRACNRLESSRLDSTMSANSPLSSPRLSPRSMSGSPGGSPRSENKGPSALRNELAAAKKAVEVLKQEKDHTQNKLEKLHAVLEKERAALRDVLQAARKAVDD